jgi:glycosyltransferase involved in cell wall biosynthesis
MVEHQFKLLSVIIPVYKQGKTIKKNLHAILSELEIARMPYEVIVVVDGFADNSFEEAKKEENSKLRVVGYEKNRGKGYAVRYGMARAKGDVKL